MSTFAALDVSQETTAVCVVDDAGRIIREKKIPTCPEAICSFLTRYALDRVGIETGAMAVGFGTSCMTEAYQSFVSMLVTPMLR